MRNPGNPGDEKLDNSESSNGGLVYSANKDVQGQTKEDICKLLSLPNIDVTFDDVQAMTKKPRMPKQNISNKTIPSLGSGTDKHQRGTTDEQALSKAAMPNSTKASHSRMFSMPLGSQVAAPETSRVDNAHDQSSNIHKSYNGGIPKQGSGLQPSTNYKGQGALMPVIGSGPGLPTEQAPKSSGFRSNRNQQYDYNLNLGGPQQYDNSQQKWHSNVSTQRSVQGSRKTGINNE